MLDALRAWLNGKRDYKLGVVLFSKLADNKPLLSLLQNGPTEFNIKRLADELLDICTKMKEESGEPEALPAKLILNTVTPRKIQLERTAGDPEPVNPVLYQSCLNEANKEYKETMNLRAQLFALANVGDFEDPNSDALVKSRSALAIKVVKMYNGASQKYDTADYVKLNGRLPEDDPDQEPNQENEYDHLPDHLVKQNLDNLRKNLNKMKKRPETPERLQLMQKHEKNIKKLEARWRSLN